ncbi:carboxypeptidase-like regulatory domain-containing protein [Verrucosispora sp. FIM060022]|uniref:carboxypeptidase-like regulatory domain-containing protein n=1 Tax=Verrucosispora sp. FIM060022 TaxID=1479020 RepID=UPI000F8809DE|nr:carboxypeptidase-like regulatory domain-containing protein [Verrucosispora sp. FIM060022]RUL94866.1 carboxypeptidase regulatory-like domain-containing protein [Verrucosispora sp. FIM060022]
MSLSRPAVAFTALALLIGLGHPLPAAATQPASAVPGGQPASALPGSRPASAGLGGQHVTAGKPGTAGTGEVRTVVRDAVTGAAVRACLNLVPADRDPLTVVSLGEVQQGRSGGCSDLDGGPVVSTDVAPGRYHLLARPYDSVRYGAQWVGPHGGTGQRERAAIIHVRPGRVVTTPRVRLDPPGTVTGRVTRVADGTPVSAAAVLLLPEIQHPKYGSQGVLTDDDGRYTMTGLGPYRWPLYFSGYGLASQWSGATADRLRATTVRVRAGATVTADTALTAGTVVSGTITTAEMPFYSQVVAFHARTGEVVGVADAAENYLLRLLPGQRVLLRCDCAYTPSRWYPNAAGIDDARTLRVRNSPVTAHFDLTGPAAP